MGGLFTLENFKCLIVNIYNPCDAGMREQTWLSIEEFCKHSSLTYLIMGDFNEILEAQDRGSLYIDPTTSSKFRTFINNLQLIEISPSDGRYTWFRGNAKSKLDRVFVHIDWLSQFPHLSSSILNRRISDHCPIIVNSQKTNWGPKPFRFQDAWFTHKGCMEVIAQSWQKNGQLSFMEKLKSVKSELKTWNNQVFENIDSNISSFEKEVHHW